jgi:hypothetical protein
MKRILFAVCAVAFVPTTWAAGQPQLDASDLASLRAMRIGESRVLEALPVAVNTAGSVRLKRIDVYAPDAKIYVVDAKGQREIPRSNWLTFVSDPADAGAARLSLAMSPDGKQVQGFLLGDDGRPYAIRGAPASGALKLTTIDDAKGIEGTRTCALDETIKMPTRHASPAEAHGKSARPNAPDGGTHAAVIAVDADGDFMTLRFADNTTNANNYVAALFAAMNVTYQRDFNLTLQIGTTFLRIGGSAADPYASTSSTPISTQLNELGAYWLANNAAVQRAFVMQLSGKLSSTHAGGFSGIAWLIGANNMCNERGFTFSGCGGTCTAGHYSVNRTNTQPNAALGSFEPIGIGHEIGHNFGAGHTHCSDAVTGVSDTNVNTIDTCYSGEAGSGCYGGATSCPAPTTINGVPNIRGTIMSYCHLLGSGGCNSTSGSSGVFANAHRTLLSPIVGANIAVGCFDPVSTSETPIFRNGFE